MRKKLLRLAALLGALAVAIGAFGAHALKPHLSPESLDTFRTGVQYHFVHVLALLGCTALLYMGRKNSLWYAGMAFVAGIILFSGSLYWLSLEELVAVPASILGPITPIGGVCFILGWLLLFYSSYQQPTVRKKASRSTARPKRETA